MDGGSAFQFHKGTIRTLEAAGLNPYLMNFNSIKVQLERQKLTNLSSKHVNFNSIKVQLEPLCKQAVSCPTDISIP